MNMPKLLPIIIKTKNYPFLMRTFLWLTSVRQWEIVEDWAFCLPNGKTIVIPKGFVFDGASIPRPFWLVLPPTGLLLIPALVHDFAYSYDYLWLLEREEGEKKYTKYKLDSGRYYWDLLFRDIGENLNGMVFIDRIAWFFLYALGRISWNKSRRLQKIDIYPGNDVSFINEKQAA